MSTFIKIQPELQNKQIAYILTDPNGQAIFAGIKPYKQLLSFLPHELSQELYLTIIDDHDDRLKLFNIFLKWCKENEQKHLEPQLHDIYKSWLIKGKGRAVVCLDTGEKFNNAMDCSRKNELTYSQLLNHLRGDKGFNSVKGMKYEYI